MAAALPRDRTGADARRCPTTAWRRHASGCPWPAAPRVVSMPSWDIFEHQPQSYREEVLPPSIKARLAVEQASALGWERYVGDHGRVIGMKAFGASAPLKELQRKFGFEPDKVVAAALEMLGRK